MYIQKHIQIGGQSQPHTEWLVSKKISCVFIKDSKGLKPNTLDKYDSGVLTLHELVNELFEPWDQVDESQHSLLSVALQTAAGGIPTPHDGTGAGGSSSDLPRNDNDKKKHHKRESINRR